MINIPLCGIIVNNDDKWIYDWFEIGATCPKDIEKALEAANGQDITIQINSDGGDVVSGNEMYYLINSYQGRKIVDITGRAASAATFVSCAGDIVRGTPGMQYMIHNVSTEAHGDYHAMDHTSNLLKIANKAITNIYRLKTNMSEKDLLKLMDEETWMDSTRAKELGFIDEIIGDNGILSQPVSLYNTSTQILSEDVKQKIRNMVKNTNGRLSGSDFLIENEKLNLLKMKGEIKHEI